MLTKIASKYLYKIAEASGQGYIDQYEKGKNKFLEDAMVSKDTFHLLHTLSKVALC